MLHQRDFRSHDTSCLDLYRIVHRNGHSDLLDIIDAQLNIGALQCFISSLKHSVDLRLYPLCLIDQPHKLTDQDISLLIH